MSDKQNSAFHTLLASWSAHQDLRKQGASVGELHDSAVRLEAVRSSMRGLH